MRGMRSWSLHINQIRYSTATVAVITRPLCGEWASMISYQSYLCTENRLAVKFRLKVCHSMQEYVMNHNMPSQHGVSACWVTIKPQINRHIRTVSYCVCDTTRQWPPDCAFIFSMKSRETQSLAIDKRKMVSNKNTWQLLITQIGILILNCAHDTMRQCSQ